MKKLFLLLTIVVLSGVFIIGCKKQNNQSTDNSSQKVAEELVTIKVGASPTPHAEILSQVKDVLKNKGYNLEIIEFDDYVMPNNALDNGDIHANYFQHTPYLEDFNKKNKLKNNLISAGIIHFEPLGLYSHKHKNFTDIKEGAVIGIPSDPTNGARALWLLDTLGIIKVKPEAAFEATELDILENPKKVVIKPLEAAQIPASLPDLDFGVINGNYALGAGILDSVLATESKDSSSANTFGNIIAIRESDKDKKEIKDLLEALKSEQIKKFVDDNYKGVVIIVN